MLKQSSLHWEVHKMRKLLSPVLFVITAVFAVSSLFVPIAYAQLNDDEAISIFNETPFYDPNSIACSGVGGPRNGASENNVYFIGDSLTVDMARGGILERVVDAGFNGTNVPYTESPDSSLGFDSTRLRGSSVEATNGIGVSATIPRVTANETDIARAGVIVIGLGTNYSSEFSEDMTRLLQEVRRVNPNSPRIYWINTYFTASRSTTYQTINTEISNVARNNSVTVIDWAAEASANPANYSLQGDGIHHTAEGNTNRVNFIVSSLGSPGAGSGGNGGSTSNASYDPISLTYPAFPNVETIIEATKDHITSRYPTSPFASNLQYVDTIFTQSEAAGINPLLVIAVAQQENGYGRANSSATENNNYFGMKLNATTYRSFATPEEGITYFIGRIEEHVKRPAGSYADVRTFYEYLSVHQAGLIAYPGEYPPGARGADASPQYLAGDPAMGGVLISWDPNANINNANPNWRGMYNPGIYFSNSIQLINRLTGLNLSNVPSRSGSAVLVNGCPQTAAGSGIVDVTGYAFPLAPQNRTVGGITVGQTVSTHHDGTDAFDLFSTQDSADVYAIFNGVATGVNTNFANIPGCSSIQFRADDGYYYWYGHLKNTTVQENARVEAGAKIAEIADRTNFTAACWGGAPHLHIDRGCTIDGVRQTAGRDECRDPEFIPFLSQLYETLPQ